MKIDVSPERIDACIACFDQEESLKERVLTAVFRDKSNKEPEKVLVKVTLLNSFYSTQLFNNPSKSGGKNTDIVSMALHIAATEELDQWLASDDPEENLQAFRHITECTSVRWGCSVRKAPSFASKYCSWHYQEKYPIMDSYSKGMLYYINRDPETRYYTGKLTTAILQDYRTFSEVFRTFKDWLGVSAGRPYTVKELDKYLWMYGKDHNIALD